MANWSKTRFLAAPLLSLLAVAACSGSDPDPSAGAPAPTSTSTSTSTPSTSSIAEDQQQRLLSGADLADAGLGEHWGEGGAAGTHPLEGCVDDPLAGARSSSAVLNQLEPDGSLTPDGSVVLSWVLDYEDEEAARAAMGAQASAMRACHFTREDGFEDRFEVIESTRDTALASVGEYYQGDPLPFSSQVVLLRSGSSLELAWYSTGHGSDVDGARALLEGMVAA